MSAKGDDLNDWQILTLDGIHRIEFFTELFPLPGASVIVQVSKADSGRRRASFAVDPDELLRVVQAVVEVWQERKREPLVW